MIRFAPLLMVSALFVVGQARAKDAFSGALTPAEKQAAGIAHLSAAELAQLDTLVERYKTGALAEARRQADEAVAAKQAAEAAATRAAAQVEEMKTKAAKAEAAQKNAEEHATKLNVLARAKGILKFDAKADEPLAESVIVGKFRGWNPRQVFTLANGQRWQIANNESYYSPVQENVKVQIFPASLFGYWMRFPDLRTQVRVNFLAEK